MKTKNYFNEFSSQIIEYKNYILYIEKLLQEYAFEDKVHLFFIHKKLKEKIIYLENILEKLKFFDEKKQNNIQIFSVKYFRKLKAEFDDFFIILRWSNFSSIYMKLHLICEKKLSTTCIERKNYNNLLNRLEESS